jgi:predicted membrane channel-forming protein YqfA (hemolysin III family)
MFSKTDIERYFMAEKQESLLFIIIGALAILAAIAFYFLLKSAFFRGAAFPLLLIGLIQLTVGYTVYKRSDADRIRNVYAYDMNPGALKQQEIPRMEKVNRNFVIYRWVELALLVAGLILSFTFGQNPGRSFWYGLGIALSLQAVIMLAADYMAEKRALDYTRGLKAFTSQSR